MPPRCPRARFRIPVSGWSKCVHEAAAFESKGAYATALILAVWRRAPRHTGDPTLVGRRALVELRERDCTDAFAMSNGAPPAASGMTWSTVKSEAGWAGRP